MQLTISRWKERKSAEALILPFWQVKNEAESASEAKEFVSHANAPIRAGDFRGKEGECFILYGHKSEEKRILLLGLGPKSKCTHDSIRRSYANATKALHKKNTSINVVLPHSKEIDEDVLFKAVVEGMLLSDYTFSSLKEDTKKDNVSILEKICFIGGPKKAPEILAKTKLVISAVNFARDLVNGNAYEITPTRLAKEAKALEKEFSHFKTTIFHRKEMEKEKMGLLLAVAKGAAEEPAFIIMEYKGNPGSKDYTALIGKGITFDTGGLNLKPSGSIETQKADMAGGAAVLGTMQAAAGLKLKVNLIGVIASTENAIGSRSYKPGDVYKSYSGKTVEIADTDAEGRLVLADAISYTQENFAPSRMIDLATLTGGIIVALGEEATGLFSNDDELADALTSAGLKTHERLWRFPLYPEYKDYLKSSIADIKNSGGGRKASSIKGAIFLEQFVKDIPWAHLDIAGTAYLSELNKPYHPTYGTGVGVRLLIEYLESLT